MTDHMYAEQHARDSTRKRPGWVEIGVGLGVGVLVLIAIALLTPLASGSDPVVYGLLLAAASGALGLIGFAAAFAVRLRSWGAFNVRRTTWKWIALGALAGVVALLLKGLVNFGVIALTGLDDSPQAPYGDAAGGGVLPLILTFAFLTILTPLGEEFLFRGVIATALLRYGWWAGVVGSSVVFALFHGISLALPSALVVGIIAAEMMRRSRSIWPAVMVHVVNNAALPLFVLIAGSAAVA
ncbi:hypothetical protein CLV46_2556 [Diaminobutyricimonas aerilata]|uniref:CAAX prenyl protease 2/Lysostaphin resistance protein A-like domain-containing protein n=1 Tax=Diaminobutyricimonas aerilata TaxID=1162967 RepID=A0A2M9CM66_9MICO|nr:type II CAAX endopeptidase family protein [Diaminobutyricimonas aerilata]PJJ72976.1 hypothetical protein CLV46_2556 [Diaminobutyricimonas aerilata]